MNWTLYVDGYCERTAPGLLNEPLNAITNGAFLLVAYLAARKARQSGADGAQWALIVLVAAIGTGSLLFHTIATRWAMLADVIPITLFIYGYLGFALRRYFRAGWMITLVCLAGLLVVNLAVERWLPANLLNGSIMYLPALLAVIAAALVAWQKRLPVWRPMMAAAGVLLASLGFRTMDQAVCDGFPAGTHFLWHLFNAGVLGIYLAAALRYGTRASSETN